MTEKTGYCSLIYQNEFINYLKSLKISYVTVERILKDSRILARKGLLKLSENEFELEIWERYRNNSTRSRYKHSYRKYWGFRNEICV